MKTVTIVALCCALAGCAGDKLGHEPEVKTSVVEKAVPVPCRPQMPLRPELFSREQLRDRLAAIPTFDDRMKLVADQLLLYMGWVPVLDTALASCAHPAGQTGPSADATTR